MTTLTVEPSEAAAAASDHSLLELVVKSAITHSVTYFIMGLFALAFLGYESLFEQPQFSAFMRQVDDPVVMAGPLFQPLRGALFGIAFFLLKDAWAEKRHAWLILWVTLFIFSILNPFGPTPGSIEGMIYTLIPLGQQLIGWVEVGLQALLLAVVLTVWLRHPSRWLNWVMGIAFAIVIILPVLGLLAQVLT